MNPPLAQDHSNNTVLPFATDTVDGLGTTEEAEVTGVAADALLVESVCKTERKEKYQEHVDGMLENMMKMFSMSPSHTSTDLFYKSLVQNYRAIITHSGLIINADVSV